MEKIAIIGLSCLFPDAKNPEEFWQNLVGQKNSISSATVEDMGVNPAIFYDSEKRKADKTYSLKGGFIRNFKFEGAGYNLPSEVIDSLDDTFKWSLYVAKQAIQNSGYWGNAAALSKCGVILGNLSFPTKASNQLFAPFYKQAIEPAVQELLQNTDFHLADVPTSGPVSPHNAMISGFPAALVAQALSLSSIHFCLDAACSSSLYSVKLASHYLESHKADLMLAGAISSADPLFVRMLFSGVQGYAENGISRPLDKSSKGLIPADGIGMLVLKRYSDAVRDGDEIYATVCGNGLSNDGRGKHLLCPSSKGQILAFERAYAEAGINPKEIDYIESHFTGTALGDSTELNSLDTFFGQHQAAPLVGTVKANVGHLLTAAGMVGMIKAILSMSKGVIPPTINITDPLSSPNQVISEKQIVRTATSWPNNAPLKRAAISAFGFGGTNAHLILEQGAKVEPLPPMVTQPVEPVPTPKIAIVGMDAFFGSAKELDAFERSIYEGNQHFIPLPTQRWQGIEEQEQLLKENGFEGNQAPKGAYIESFDIDTLRFKIHPNEANELNPQQLLLLKVADRALKDAELKEGGNVAVIIAAETELSVHQLQKRWNLPWQIKEGLNQGEIILSAEQISELETIIKDSLHNSVETSEYLSHIANIMACRISALWNFTGPSFTLSAGENSTFKALEVAQMLLATKEVDAVVVGAVDLAGGFENVLLRNKSAKINTGVNTLSYDQKANGWMVGEGAGAVVLKLHETAKQDNNCIYAVIDALTLVQKSSTSQSVESNQPSSDSEAVAQACKQAFKMADVQPKEIGYLEVTGSGVPQEDESEIEGLLQAYRVSEPELTCAIGSVKANIGHTYTASGMASLIKTVLCLYHRYIPTTPQWTGPKAPEVWQGSPFYVATDSRPWLLDAGTAKRVAAINGIGSDETYAHLIVSEELSENEPCQKGTLSLQDCRTEVLSDRRHKYLQQMSYHLFAIAADNSSDLIDQLKTLQQTIETCASLSATASRTFETFKKHREAPYALAILGRNRDELTKEIQRAFQGVANAFQRGEDWKTPVGSYFSAKPLGKKGKIAYVYPGAFGAYVGMARTIGRLFPKIFDHLLIRSVESSLPKVGKLLFPRSLTKLTTKQQESLEQRLLDDVIARLEAEIGYATLLSVVIRDYFKIKPDSIFGYCLGENTMMYAQGIWSGFNQGSNGLNASVLFETGLSGPKNVVREYWGLPQQQEDTGREFWSSCVLMAPVSQVKECLKQEDRVYLSQVNTPEEVVIAGDTQACQRVIAQLKCHSITLPFNLALHCEPVRSVYDELLQLNTLPIQNIPESTVYSAAEYGAIAIDSQTVGRSIAHVLSQQVDFPRLVNRVYEDGTRIFIEAGSGTMCSRWIGETLKQKEHLTVTFNRRGIDDHTSIIKGLAVLLSHRVDLDLSPLYANEKETSRQPNPIVKTITLGGSSIHSTILSETNKKLFRDVSSKMLQKHSVSQQSNPKLTESEKQTYSNGKSPMNGSKNPSTSPILPDKQPEKLAEKSIVSNSFIALQNPQYLSDRIGYEPRQNNLDAPHYQKLSENTARAAKAHAAFLQARQQSLQQMSEIIQLQMAVSQQLIEQGSTNKN